jgi:hypothetical protein
MLHLATQALEDIQMRFLPEVHRTDVGGVPCWRNLESITLPEDFSEKLTTAIDTLVELEEKVTPAKLEFVLSLFYRIHFCKEYALSDTDVFIRICERNYHGNNDVFSKSKKLNEKANNSLDRNKRVRSPNTRFCKIGVPIGAVLFYTKHDSISCVVLDDINQVEYEGKTWSISSLAINLLNVSSANGFCYFSYEGETLWERRLRLERGE